MASSMRWSKAWAAARPAGINARAFAGSVIVTYRAYRGRNVGRLLSSCAYLLPTVRRQRVVLVVSRERRSEVGGWVAHLPQHSVLVVGEGAAGLSRMPRRVTAAPASTIPVIHEAVRSLGAVHLIVDLRSRDIDEYRETWRALFFHLRRGGVHLIPRSTAATEAELSAWTAEVAAPVPKESPESALRKATGKAVLLPDLLALVKGNHHYLVVRDDEVGTLLPKRERGAEVEVLRELPPGTMRSRAQVTSYGASIKIWGMFEDFTYPALRLRHYTAPIVFGGRTLLYTGRSILPDSFRFYRHDKLDHPMLGFVSPDFRTIRPGLAPREDLEGDYFVVDSQWTGHFGHVMTEVVPRLWGWDEAKARYPDLKALFAVPRGEPTDPLVRRLLLAYGIAENDQVGVDHPVRVRSLVSANAMWHNASPHFVHPGIAEVWDRIGAGLVGPTPAAGPERIFVSRRETLVNRACRNASDVEQYFESFGFTVVFPEELDLAEQANVFRSARVIAGFGGSNMFSLMYAQHLEHLILLNQEAYTARHEHLYSSVVGGPVSYFWSTPEVLHEPGSWSGSAFISGWTFDFERNGAALEKVLSGLDV